MESVIKSENISNSFSFDGGSQSVSPHSVNVSVNFLCETSKRVAFQLTGTGIAALSSSLFILRSNLNANGSLL